MFKILKSSEFFQILLKQKAIKLSESKTFKII